MISIRVANLTPPVTPQHVMETVFMAAITNHAFAEDGSLREGPPPPLGPGEAPERLEWAIVPGLAAAVDVACACAPVPRCSCCRCSVCHSPGRCLRFHTYQKNTDDVAFSLCLCVSFPTTHLVIPVNPI